MKSNLKGLLGAVVLTLLFNTAKAQTGGPSRVIGNQQGIVATDLSRTIIHQKGSVQDIITIPKNIQAYPLFLRDVAIKQLMDKNGNTLYVINHMGKDYGGVQFLNVPKAKGVTIRRTDQSDPQGAPTNYDVLGTRSDEDAIHRAIYLDMEGFNFQKD